LPEKLFSLCGHSPGSLAILFRFFLFFIVTRAPVCE
jgi:hypothetical protein